MKNTIKKTKIIVIVSAIIALVVLTVILVPIFSNKEVYRIVSYGTKTTTVEVWKDNYWEGPLEVKKIPGINRESAVGDFVNSRLQFVDTNGSVLKTRPEAKSRVYTITGVESDANINWTVVDGPLTYVPGQCATTMQISDPTLKIGDFINEDWIHVDMFGYGIKD